MRNLAPVGAALLLALVAVGGWFLLRNGGGMAGAGAVRLPDLSFGGAVYEGAPLTQDYRNEQFRFALVMPNGFSASELPPDENGGTAVIFQDGNGEGIQVYVTPAGNERTLDAEDIRAAIPDMEVAEPQPVEIGDTYRGTAFLSDNDAFGGESSCGRS